MGQQQSEEHQLKDDDDEGGGCEEQAGGRQPPGELPMNRKSANKLKGADGKRGVKVLGSVGQMKDPAGSGGEGDESARRLSNVSHRNIQLLSMRPQSEVEAYADGLKNRRRSSLIHMILGAPSSGPRFSDDLCSLTSHQISEYNFGIEFFPDNVYQCGPAAGTPSISSIMGIGPLAGDNQRNRREQQRQNSSLSESGGQTKQAASKIPVKATISGPRANPTGDNTKQLENAAALSNRRRSSIGSLALAKFISTHGAPAYEHYSQQAFDEGAPREAEPAKLAPSRQDTVVSRQQLNNINRKPSLSSTLASIDLTSSFELHDKIYHKHPNRPPLSKARQTIFESVSQESLDKESADFKSRLSSKSRLNQAGRVLRRCGSELSLYSNQSASGASVAGSAKSCAKKSAPAGSQANPMKETKLIIMLQVCLPFILAGFGNMAAGLVLNKVAHWRAFQRVPIFFVLLPPFVGLKGNIEMTLASRLSTLSNLNLLKTAYERKRAFLSNLVLVLSQAIGLSIFASLIAILCEIFISGSQELSSNLDLLAKVAFLIVLPSALATSIILVLVSSLMMSLAIALANLIQVNPDNLSTLVAALYGDVSCVFVYGIIADWTYTLVEIKGVDVWPMLAISSTVLLWPVLLFVAYKLKETHTIALSSIPPMLTSIMISMGSGAILSVVVTKFSLIALYQPVVNGFGANLIAVQASRVSTWLWCSALRRISASRENHPEGLLVATDAKLNTSLASFTEPIIAYNSQVYYLREQENRKFRPKILLQNAINIAKTIFWSFCNSSPNSVAAKLLLLMLIPAHSIYFIVIWLLSETVKLTFAFYIVYMSLCLLQVLILLTICEPLMTLLMNRRMDPDIFGISILMALADLIGTMCLTGAFSLLQSFGDVNAMEK